MRDYGKLYAKMLKKRPLSGRLNFTKTSLRKAWSALKIRRYPRLLCVEITELASLRDAEREFVCGKILPLGTEHAVDLEVAVFCVAYHGITGMCKVCAYLMRLTGM